MKVFAAIMMVWCGLWFAFDVFMLAATLATGGAAYLVLLYAVCALVQLVFFGLNLGAVMEV